MRRRAILACLLTVSFAAACAAQSKPNFSGTWKLNTSKSDFGMIPGPDSRTDVIDHAEPNVKITTSQAGPQGKMEASLTYTTDGKEASNKMGPRDVKSIVGWEGNSLVVTSKLNFNEQEVTIKASWSLSEDGKTMTQNVHLAAQMGETDQKLVFEKQPDGAMTTATAPEKAIAPTPSIATGPKPNFSGVWKLNAAKSDFSVIPGPDSRTDTIEHKEPNVKIARTENGPEGARDYVLTMTDDGKESVNNLGPIEAHITATWEGNAHVMTMKLKIQDMDVTIKRTSTLSEDGKTMTAMNHIVSAMGELDQKEVYEKQ